MEYNIYLIATPKEVELLPNKNIPHAIRLETKDINRKQVGQLLSKAYEALEKEENISDK